MSFEARVIAFADRFLSERNVQLIVEPALADLQFDGGTAPLGRTANRLAVLKAVAGGCVTKSRAARPGSSRWR